jgi:hypothetical protein
MRRLSIASTDLSFISISEFIRRRRECTAQVRKFDASVFRRGRQNRQGACIGCEVRGRANAEISFWPGQNVEVLVSSRFLRITNRAFSYGFSKRSSSTVVVSNRFPTDFVQRGAPGDLMIVPAEEIFAAVAADAVRVERSFLFRPCLALDEWGVRALPFVS